MVAGRPPLGLPRASPRLGGVRDPLTRMPDGTIKQVNPFSGTEVWTLPGRANRPLSRETRAPRPLELTDLDSACAFCAFRKLEVTPELARLVPTGEAAWSIVRNLHAEQLDDTVADFRLVSNLFEILGYDYWRTAHGYHHTPAQTSRQADYLSTPMGRKHVEDIVHAKARASGYTEADLARRTYEDDLADAAAFFTSNHQVVIPRRHYVDGAHDDRQLASSGTLTPEEHAAYLGMTVTAVKDLYDSNPFAKYVAVYQNWLAPAGASFEHLHKQVVAIDELGGALQRELAAVRAEPDLYSRWGEGYARDHGLVVAENEHGVAFAGIGHRFPSLEVHSREHRLQPWQFAPEQMRGLSDLVHAMHAAVGTSVSSNEEWHLRPPTVPAEQAPMPVRVVLKLRISTPAGFEGGTKIHINTIDPFTVAGRTLSRLRELRRSGEIAPTLRLP